MIGLNATVAVYTPNGTDGDYTVVARASLPCRMAVKPLPVPTGGAGGDRVELADRRLLMWDADYAMPDTARVLDSAGVYWNVIPGTYVAVAGLTAVVGYRRCEVERVLS